MTSYVPSMRPTLRARQLGVITGIHHQTDLAEAIVAAGQQVLAWPGAQRPRISQWTWVKFFARYALIAVALYVTVSRSHVPLVSVLGGLLMLGAAAMAVGLYEVLVETR